jgi:hypothetical protein
MTHQRQPVALRGKAPSAEPGADDGAALQLAQTLIALHRSERAPRALVRQVEAHLAGGSKSAVPAAWARRLDALRAQLAGWPLAGVVALVPLLLVTWQHQRLSLERRQTAEAAALQAEQRASELAVEEVTLSGVAVPGSLQLVLSGDDIGMGHCSGSFLMEPEGGHGPAPVRVRWSRCDLPEELSGELRRVFSPLRGAPPFPVRVRGHWAHAREFEALGLRL